MKSISQRIVLILVALIVASSSAALAAQYTVDAGHSGVGFQIKHMTISKVNGSFGDFAGTFTFTEGDATSWQVSATIQIASIDTGHEDRDEHLLSDEFFDAAQFPTMTFKSTKITMTNDSEGKMLGELTMHGVTKAIELDLEYNGSIVDPWGNERAGFSVTGKINRKDWGLTYNSVLEAGGLTLGEDVKITLDIEGIKNK